MDAPLPKRPRLGWLRAVWKVSRRISREGVLIEFAPDDEPRHARVRALIRKYCR